VTEQPKNLPNILVVDDEPGIRRALKRILSRNYNTDIAPSGEEALRKLEQKRYDIAIVDLRMPGMDGFQLLRTIKLYRPHTEVIIMSGSASEEKLIEAIQDQAFYFVTKPFQKEVIETLVERCVWTQRLQRQNQAHMEQLERYLDRAKEFQAGLLPRQFPPIPGVKWGIRYVPSEVLGGDFYDLHSISPKRAAVVVADVFGHGVAAAMQTGIVKSLFVRAVRENPSPSSVLHTINEEMNRFGGETPLTLFYGVLDGAALSFRYANAGHPAPLLCRANDTIEALDSSAPLLGAGMKLPEDPALQVEVRWGDTIVLYTDGIIEAIDANRRWFGRDNLVRTIRKHANQSPHVIAEEICRAAKHFAAGGLPPDDLTAMVLRFEQPAFGGEGI
jgi:sigma-B regulation protein RsbU (phosphoserine phosphatase)